MFLTKERYIPIIKARKKVLLVDQFLAILKYILLYQLIKLKFDNKKAILLIAYLKYYWQVKYIEIQYY